MSNNDQYLGNPNLKKANTAIDFTPDEVAEVLKCSEDPVYFIKNYIKIVSLDKGLIPFDMYHFQEEMVSKFHDHRFNIAKLPRQSGKSTIVTSYLLWYVLFNPNVNVAILANKAATAREMLQRLQLSYENLPKWAQQGILQWNRGSLELENGSKIMPLLLPLLLSGVCLLTSYFWTNSRSFRITLLISSLVLSILLFLLVSPQKSLSFLPLTG